jgi:iron complex transport system substrate-binding protein
MKKILFIGLIFCFILSFDFNVLAGQQDNPKRIISLGAYLTEGLFLLGIEDNVIGVTTYCNRPEEAKNKPKAGTVVDVNIEKVISLKPDLILATPLTNSRDKQKLRDLGFNLKEFSQVKNFQQICEQFLELGQLVGKKEKAVEIVNKARKQVELVESSVSDMPPKKVFIQVGTKPLFTMNKSFYVDDIIKKAKGINIASNDQSGIYSREKVITEDPDVIIITSMGLAAEDEINLWQRYKTIKAVKNHAVFAIDPDIVCNPIPNNFADSLKIIAGYVHGKN